MQQGKIIIYPTETFLAVGCDMFHEKALEQVFFSKNRPNTKPLPLLASHLTQVQRIASWGAVQQRLATKFWPGPLTILCEAKAHVPECITAGTGRVAIRISSHAMARYLSTAMDAPLVCSSANVSGEAPPRILQELSPSLLEHVHGIVWQEPEPSGGLPSTIVEICGENTLRIRRHGALSVEQLKAEGWIIEEE